jgi:WD40 repeat protein
MMLSHRLILNPNYSSLADGAQFVSGGKDGTLRIFDTESGEQVVHLVLDARYAWAALLQVSVDDTQVLVGCIEKASAPVQSLVLYNFRDPHSTRDMETVPSHSKAVTCMAFSPSGIHLAR